MASLKEVAQIVFNQVFPKSSDETPLDREEFFITAKNEYAYQMWRRSKEEGREEGGMFHVPTHLLEEKTFKVENDTIDISELKTLKSLTRDSWIVNIGGLDCECKYVRSNINLERLLCDDDSMPHRTFIIVGKQIRFPKGVHANELPVIYAKSGDDIDDDMEVDDDIAAIVRVRLMEIYLGRVGKEDETNNSNSNQ